MLRGIKLKILSNLSLAFPFNIFTRSLPEAWINISSGIIQTLYNHPLFFWSLFLIPNSPSFFLTFRDYFTGDGWDQNHKAYSIFFLVDK